MRSKTPAKVIAADDDRIMQRILSHTLEQANIKADIHKSGEDLLKNITEHTQVAVLDMVMPGLGGMECLREIKAKNKEIEVIVLTGLDKAQIAIDSLRNGAFEYITKPFNPEELALIIKQALRVSQSNKENKALKQSLSEPKVMLGYVGESAPIKKIFKMTEKMAKTNNTILITGESGTGKGVLARAIHQASPRSKGPFMTVSCPAMPRELLESELFGHERGAFSGASEKRLGRIELAKGGTLFLDEIGEMPLDLQPKILNFLQDRNYFSVGGQKTINSDVRIIVATNKNLKELVSNGNFREDLYYRLNVLPIELPPLRKRPDDIPLLLEHFISSIRQASFSQPCGITKEAESALLNYQWPGNIRELENIIQRALTFLEEDENIGIEHLAPEIFDTGMTGGVNPSNVNIGKISLSDLEKIAILETIKHCDGVKVEAARILGITEKSIYNKIKRHDISSLL